MLDHRMAFEAVKMSFVTATRGQCVSFPPVLGHGSEQQNRFSIKSATRFGDGGLTGAKIGSYWPGNAEKGLPRHNSCILLFNEERGKIAAVIEGSGINGLRTAAADAVAAQWLARPDSRILTIFGAGNQARYEVEAIRRIRPIEAVYIVNRDLAKADSYARELHASGVCAFSTTAEEGCRRADIIVTATGSRAPLFEAAWVRPGTHVASMGSDAVGKQELPPELLVKARLFSDLPSQSIVIGEFQHIADEISRGLTPPAAIGDVISGTVNGRMSKDDITVFDSSGIALQDLFIGELILKIVETRQESFA